MKNKSVSRRSDGNRLRSWADVPKYARALGCPRCKEVFSADRNASEVVDDGYGALRCPHCFPTSPVKPLGPTAPKTTGGFLMISDAIFDFRLPPDAVCLLLALKKFEWVPGQWVDPSVKTLADMCQVSESSVQRRLKELSTHRADEIDDWPEEFIVEPLPWHGLLLRERRGQTRTNAYCLSPFWIRCQQLALNGQRDRSGRKRLNGRSDRSGLNGHPDTPLNGHPDHRSRCRGEVDVELPSNFLDPIASDRSGFDSKSNGGSDDGDGDPFDAFERMYPSVAPSHDQVPDDEPLPF